MTAYYNEIDPFAAQWLRNLINAGHIAPGIVDERSIEDVYPSDLRGFTQCHFFAGIGVWSYALRSAGWSDDRPVWTGSCPCQPFSAAGKGVGFDDERHLWPHFHHLIKECGPAIVLGEQVASKDADPWIDLVCTDLEALGYAFGAIPFPSAGVGAPHIRDRLYWVAYANFSGRQPQPDAERARVQCEVATTRPTREQLSDDSAGISGGVADTNGSEPRRWELRLQPENGGDIWVSEYLERSQSHHTIESPTTGPTNGYWRDADWLFCRDGKWRPVEPGTFPLAHGVAARVVYTCATCKTETVTTDENMRTLRSFPGGHEGLRSSAILFNEMLRAVDNDNSLYTRERTLSGAIQICSREVRALQQSKKCGAPPQGWQCNEQLPGKYRAPVSKVSCGRTSPEGDPNPNMQSLRHGIRGSEVEEQHMFCPVCAGMGPHQRKEEMGGARAARLKGYGNAINAKAAQAFIECVMDTTPPLELT